MQNAFGFFLNSRTMVLITPYIYTLIGAVFFHFLCHWIKWYYYYYSVELQLFWGNFNWKIKVVWKEFHSKQKFLLCNKIGKCNDIQYCKLTFIRVREIFASFARVSSSQIFLASNQSISHGSYNKAGLKKAWLRTLVVAYQFLVYSNENYSIVN